MAQGVPNLAVNIILEEVLEKKKIKIAAEIFKTALEAKKMVAKFFKLQYLENCASEAKNE